MKRFLTVLAMLFIVTLPVRAQVQLPPQIANEGATGTSAAHLVKLTGAPSTLIISTAGDTQGTVGICDTRCGTTDSPNVSTGGVDVCVFDNGTTAGDYVQISTSVNGDCHDTGAATLPTSGEVVGRALSTNVSSGTYNVLLILSSSSGGGSSGVNAGTIGQLAAYQSTNSVSSIPLAVYVDAIAGAGIGAVPTSWVTATSYPLCQSVSHSGNYIAVSANNSSTTPGTNRSIWYPVPNGSRPTQLDCAFYIAQSIVTSTAGVDLQLGNNSPYNSCIAMTYPTVSSPGFPGVNIHGGGKTVSSIKQTCTLLSGSGGDGLAMLNVPPASVAFQLPRLEFSDFTLDANALAWNFDLHACQQCKVHDVDFLNPAPGSDHAFEAGTIGGTNKGWVYELDFQNSALVYNAGVTGFGHGNGLARFTVTVTAGVPSIAVTNGGANYDAGQLDVRLVRAGGLEACSVPGTNTPTVSSGVITAITSTATGCAATGLTFVQVYPGLQVDYGYKFSDMTDSDTISNLDPGVGRKCGIYTANVNNFNVYTKLHPQGTFDGVCANGSETFIGTQIDSVYNHGINIGSSFNQLTFFSTGFEWNNTYYEGSSDWYIQNLSNPPSGSQASITSYHDYCGNTPQQDGYAHIVAGAGIVDTGSAMPPRMNMYGTMYCNQFTTSTQLNATNTTGDVVWSNGKFSNIWDWDLASGGNSTMTLTNPAGSWAMNWLNPIAATSGANSASPIFSLQGQYWDGSITQPYGPRMRATFAAGTNPLTTFRFDHNGTEPSGGHIWTVDAPFVLQNASAGSTTTAGAMLYDTTLKNYHFGANGVDNLAVLVPSSVGITDNDCVAWNNASGVISLVDTGLSCGSGGSGTVTHTLGALTLDGLVFGNGSSDLNIVTPPTVNGSYLCGYTVVASAAVAPTCNLPGVTVDTQSSATPAPTSADRASVLNTTNNTTSTATAVPSASSLGSNFPFVTCNTGSVVNTLTPATSTINGNSTQKLLGQVSGNNPECAFWWSDNTNYLSAEILPTDANGRLQAAGMPALTGDATNTAGTLATTVSGINGTSFAGTSGNFVSFGAGNTPADSGVPVSSLAPAPATQASVAGENICGYNQGTGAWTLCNLAPFSPITPASDTLTNASLTSEQFFATNPSLPANAITTGTEFTINVGGDYTGTGTPATGTLRVRLCGVGLPTPSACVILFQSAAVAPGVNTRSAFVPIHIIGTTTPGSSVSIIAFGGNGQSTTIWGADAKGSSIVTGVHTSAQLFIVTSIQYAATTSSSSLQLTGVWAQPGPII